MMKIRAFYKATPKWVIGITVATPIAATIQGCCMLYEYRKKHGHAPYPISPSEGIVVVQSSLTHLQSKTKETQQNQQQQRPIRLLVLGDSLAAGVGISKSAAPILPQSIARALSEASGGRAVHWTCIGTPGADAEEIVQNLRYYKSPSTILEEKFTAWQKRKEKAQEWWNMRRQNTPQNDQKEKFDNNNKVRKWWVNLRKDVEDLKCALKEVTKEEENQREPEKKADSTPFLAENNYDVAVVLTGVNDIKKALLPFMRNDNEHQNGNKLKDSVIGIILALQRRMSRKTQEDSLSLAPLVVFPGIPTNQVPMTQYSPLNWFLVPLFKSMDESKRKLQKLFPGFVIFVEPPTNSQIEAWEGVQLTSDYNTSTNDKNKAQNKILLQLTNITQASARKVKKSMKQHYDQSSYHKHNELEDDDITIHSQSDREHSTPNPKTMFFCQDGIHPNDLGYEFLGYHISNAIVQEWKKKIRSS